ncbi:MAG: hypothetical protein JWN46_3521, partial [Acidimicrobiales bacterium]|nr:hypothetical protein [Acidimicrobiales bacterium]
MSTNRRKPNAAQAQAPAPARKVRSNRPDPVEFWAALPDPEPPAPITPMSEVAVTALLRSLGSPPLTGQGGLAERELAKVTVRAAELAAGLAATAGLLGGA